MSWLSSALGLDKTPHTSVDGQLTTAANTAGTNATDDRSRYLGILNGGQDALNTSTQAAVNSAMPALNQNLQSSRESAVRRGISTGDLGTSNEGDIYSAFQKNVANAAGQQAMNMYNTQTSAAGSLYGNDQNQYLSLLRGNQSYQENQQNVKKAKSAGLFGGLGAAVGGAFGGPMGASIGGSIGSALGS
jgi:hypothetical protein